MKVYAVGYGATDFILLAVFLTQEGAEEYIHKVTEEGSKVFAGLPNMRVLEQEVY